MTSLLKNKKAPSIHRHFSHRLAKSAGLAGFVLIFSLGIGVLGYHYICDQHWIDALLNASMILTGMGPVNVITTNSGKVFASGYALFSGVAFLTMASVMISPFLHRFLRTFHMDLEP